MSGGNPSSWSWNFPGGTPSTSNVQNPSIQYNTPGVYEVSLTVTNASGSDTQTFPGFVEVRALPTAGFNFVVNDLEVSFSNTSSNADTYSWDFGDGTTSTDENPLITYAVAGTYQVELTAINPCGSTRTTLTVVATDPVFTPTSDFALSTTGVLCAGQTLSFSDLSGNGPTSWLWEFPGGTPSTSTLSLIHI